LALATASNARPRWFLRGGGGTTFDDQTILEARGITCSLSRRGNGDDNAVMESFFSTVKSELRDRFDSCGEAKMELFDDIEGFYSQRRRHSTVGQIGAAAFERRAMTQAA
jgi:putative transposase